MLQRSCSALYGNTVVIVVKLCPQDASTDTSCPSGLCCHSVEQQVHAAHRPVVKSLTGSRCARLRGENGQTLQSRVPQIVPSVDQQVHAAHRHVVRSWSGSKCAALRPGSKKRSVGRSTWLKGQGVGVEPSSRPSLPLCRQDKRSWGFESLRSRHKELSGSANRRFTQRGYIDHQGWCFHRS